MVNHFDTLYNKYRNLIGGPQNNLNIKRNRK